MPQNDVLDRKIELSQQKIARYEQQISEAKLMIENEQRLIAHYESQKTEE